MCPNQGQDWTTELNEFGREKLEYMRSNQPKLYNYLNQHGELKAHLLDMQRHIAVFLQSAGKTGLDHKAMMNMVRDTWINEPDRDPSEEA